MLGGGVGCGPGTGVAAGVQRHRRDHARHHDGGEHPRADHPCPATARRRCGCRRAARRWARRQRDGRGAARPGGHLRARAPQPHGELHRGRPRRGVLRQAGLDDRRDPRGHAAQVGRHRHDPVERRGGLVGRERAARRRGPGQRRAQREHVALGAALARALDLLGGHEVRRADDLAGDGEPRRVDRPRDPEVDHSGPAGGEEHVGGLQVAVDEPGRVDRRQRLGEPAGQVEQRVLRHRPVGEHGLAQRRPFDELRGEPRRLAVRVGVEHARGEQAHDRRGRGDLPPEPLPEAGVVGEVVADHLDGRAAPVRGGRGVHPSHAPDAQPPDDAEATDQRRVVGLERLHIAEPRARTGDGSPRPSRSVMTAACGRRRRVGATWHDLGGDQQSRRGAPA